MRNFKGMPLEQLIDMKTREFVFLPGAVSPFGTSTEGEVLNQWQTAFQRIEFFTKYYGITDFGAPSLIMVDVPPTETGVFPVDEKNLPYGWNGKINGHIADLAIWWAFELLSPEEADLFFVKERPLVQFSFIEKSRQSTLIVKYQNTLWTVESYT